MIGVSARSSRSGRIEGSAFVHSVSPVRLDERKMHAPTRILGRLMMTASQTDSTRA